MGNVTCVQKTTLGTGLQCPERKDLEESGSSLDRRKEDTRRLQDPRDRGEEVHKAPSMSWALPMGPVQWVNKLLTPTTRGPLASTRCDVSWW